MAGRLSLSVSGTSATLSGIGGLGAGIAGRGQLRRNMFNGRHVDKRAAGNSTLRRRRGRKNLWRRFPIKIGNLGFNLSLELVGRALELVQSLPDLPTDFGHLLGPENNQGQ